MDRGGRRDRSRSHERQRGEQQVEITVARRVYVGNLSYRTSWQDLKDHFGQVGTVRYADVLREGGPSGRSKVSGSRRGPALQFAALYPPFAAELQLRPHWIVAGTSVAAT
jgi:RNA recognition motif-containing protein